MTKEDEDITILEFLKIIRNKKNTVDALAVTKSVMSRLSVK